MKTKNYLFMLATLFSAAIGFTACSSEDDLASSEQEERGVVKTEFTISFPQTTTGRTRQSADVVQAAAASNLTKFRGIKGIILYPFSVDASGVSGTTDVPAAITLYGGTTVGKAGASGTDHNTIAGYDATTYTPETGLGSLYKESSAHLYKNVDIAIGTKSFIFYGEAATTNTQAAQQVGSLTKTVEAGDKTLDGITYSPTPIFTGAAVGSNGNTIAAYLTSIAQAKTEANDKWLESATAGNVGLATLYDNFTKITAGSWTNVKAIVQRMYTNLAPKTEDTDKTVAMKNAIRTAIVNDTYGVSVNEGVLGFSESYGNFPADLGLPDGAAQLTCNATTGVFSYIVTKEENTGMNVTPLAYFAYPASLYYFVKSDIKTSEVAKESYSDTETWTTITNAYTDGASVTSKTRSIVIKDKVQYAVGRLDVTVKSSGTSLLDGNSQSINTMSGANPLFPVTGILVGMQKPVGWNFEQKGGTSYTVYDNQVADGATRYLTTTESTAIHTLLLETNDATSGTDTNADVNIAVEFLNNSDKTIVGYNGQLILPKTKFYLLGTLHPWKDDYGTDPVIKRAFKQDYITTANLTVTSLANAHNTLPDLTVPSLSLGLSIDMEWKTGVTYDINIQ